MNKKPTFGESLQRFIEGKGFYVVVLVCVLAIGASGFYLLYSANAGPEPNRPVNASAQVVVTPSASPSPSPSAAAPSPSPAPSASGGPKVTPPVVSTPAPSQSPAQSPAPAASASPKPSPSPAPSRAVVLVYTWPVKGELLADFSLETLAYDVTMGDWRTHSGIDIAAPLGSTVMSTADGTVKEIFSDDLMGTTVVIEHGEGITSRYANLQSTPTVKAGDRVYTGTVIGSVGATAIAESGRASHLHFEMAKDGLAVDPELYLPKTQ